MGIGVGRLVVAAAVLAAGCLRFTAPDRIRTSETAGDVALEVAAADVTGDGRAEVLVDTDTALRPLEY